MTGNAFVQFVFFFVLLFALAFRLYAAAAGRAPVATSAATSCAAVGAWVARLGGAMIGWMSSSQSSTTQAKVSSILLRGMRPVRPRSQAM